MKKTLALVLRARFFYKLYPALMGNKTLTSKFSEGKEVRRGMKNLPLIKVSLYGL